MAVAQFSFTTLPNPTEAALKWVEAARKSSKAWTDGWLQIIATFSDVAQTQARTLKSLTPSMAAPVTALVEVPPAPVDVLAEPVAAMAEMIEALPEPVEMVDAVATTTLKAIGETTLAPAPKAETPAAAAKADPIAPPPTVEAEPAAAPANPPVAKVTVEPLTPPAPAVEAKAPPTAKPVAKVVKPAAKKKP